MCCAVKPLARAREESVHAPEDGRCRLSVQLLVDDRLRQREEWARRLLELEAKRAGRFDHSRERRDPMRAGAGRRAWDRSRAHRRRRSLVPSCHRYGKDCAAPRRPDPAFRLPRGGPCRGRSSPRRGSRPDPRRAPSSSPARNSCLPRAGGRSAPSARPRRSDGSRRRPRGCARGSRSDGARRGSGRTRCRASRPAPPDQDARAAPDAVDDAFALDQRLHLEEVAELLPERDTALRIVHGELDVRDAIHFDGHRDPPGARGQGGASSPPRSRP